MFHINGQYYPHSDVIHLKIDKPFCKLISKTKGLQDTFLNNENICEFQKEAV